MAIVTQGAHARQAAAEQSVRDLVNATLDKSKGYGPEYVIAVIVISDDSVLAVAVPSAGTPPTVRAAIEQHAPHPVRPPWRRYVVVAGTTALEVGVLDGVRASCLYRMGDA